MRAHIVDLDPRGNPLLPEDRLKAAHREWERFRARTLEELEGCLKGSEGSRWKTRLPRFLQGDFLERLRREEETLYVAWQRIPELRTAGRLLRSEHDAMRRLVNELADALHAKRMEDARGLASWLYYLFESHAPKEFDLLYQETAQCLEPGEFVEMMDALDGVATAQWPPDTLSRRDSSVSSPD